MRVRCREMVRQAFLKLVGFRMLTVVVMFFFTIDMFLKPVREYAVSIGETISPAILYIMLADAYIGKIIMLAVIYFFSNIPFMERQEQYFYFRYGRSGFCIRNLLYIIISGAVLAMLLWGLCIVDIAVCIDGSWEWDRITRTLALTNAGLRIGAVFSVPYRILENYTPLALCGYGFCCLALCISFIGMLMYACCILVGKAAAIFAAGLCVFLPIILIRASEKTVYLMPAAWASCENWRIGYNASLPDLTYIFAGYGFLLVALSTICWWKSGKM